MVAESVVGLVVGLVVVSAEESVVEMARTLVVMMGEKKVVG